MIPIAIALVVSAPLQLAAAAGVELTGGYDTTVANALTLCRYGQTYAAPCFGDGGILRTAIDIQIGHHTDTLRQTLRTRGEFYYVGGEGRPIDNGNILSLNRYTLVWEPSDRWRVAVDGSYNVGRGVLLAQNSLTLSTAFLDTWFGEYGAHGSVTRGVSENARVVFNAGLDGRQSLSVPAGTPRADQVQITAGLNGSFEVGERDTLGLTGAYQALQITGLGDWIMRVTPFATWRHGWSEQIATTVSGGLDMMQDQTDETRSRWNTGPYGSVTYQQTIPEANLGIILRGGYQFTTVNAVRCNGNLDSSGRCPPRQVIAGGAGRVASAALLLLWRPFDQNLVFQGTLGGDYGITQNFNPVPAGSTATPTTHDVGNSNFSAVAGARWIITRGISAFVRYTFLYQHVDEPVGNPDIVRHVAMAGVTFSVFAGDAEELLGVTPLEESNAAQALRGATGGASATSEGNERGNDEGTSVTDDGFGANDEPAPAERPSRSVIEREDEASTAQGRPRQPRQPTRPAAPNGRPLQPGQTPPTPQNTAPRPPTAPTSATPATSNATQPASTTAPTSTAPTSTTPTSTTAPTSTTTPTSTTPVTTTAPATTTAPTAAPGNTLPATTH
ncbi:MAG: hypothetical protein U0326_04940 [Polyangiales bacterium]